MNQIVAVLHTAKYLLIIYFIQPFYAPNTDDNIQFKRLL